MISSPIEEIKNRLDIVDVIGSYIKLSKAGANLRALCPFHAEKKPSFFVSPARQMWHCFGGCSMGGDIFKFVMKIEGVEFGDALKILAQRAGVELKPISPELKTERSRLYEICELACRFFEKQLEGSRGQEVKKYLLERGITQESVRKWRLGYSPDTWQALSDFLVGRGYKREEIVKAGLAVEKNIRENSPEIRGDSLDAYDRFRGRIIFPIFDLNSQVIGFGARVFGEKSKDEVAKYINTPATLLYDKSRVLYGLNSAKVGIRKNDNCVLVEGYTDVILAHQAGYENVAASSGTALTPYQLKILKRYSENLTTAFDMDLAGDSATKRGIDLAQAQSFNIKVLLLPEGSDPADIISKNPKDWQGILENSKSIMDFYFETTFIKHNSKTPEGKKAISKILLPVIARIPNQIEKSHWIKELADKLGVKEEAAREELKKIRPSEEFFSMEPEEKTASIQKPRRDLLEERLAALILKFPQHLNLFSEQDLQLFSSQVCQIFTYLKEKSTNGNLEMPENLADFCNYLSLKAEVELEEVDPEKECRDCFEGIKSLEIKGKLDKISKDIRTAEAEKDVPKIEKLIQEFSHLTREII